MLSPTPGTVDKSCEMPTGWSKVLGRGRQRGTQIASVLWSDSRRSVWAVADQAVVSLGNFAVNILLARYFARQHDVAALGAYFILIEPMLLLNSIQAAMVVYPLTVRGAVLDAPALGRLTSLSLLVTLLAWPVLAMGLLLTSLIAGMELAVGLWAAAALLLWQMQETVRRALMAHLRFRVTLIGDCIGYAGLAAAVVVLAGNGRLSLPAVFQAMALTMGVSTLALGWRVGLHHVPATQIIPFLRQSWGMGRWILAGNVLNVFDKLNAPQTRFTTLGTCHKWFNPSRFEPESISIRRYAGVSYSLSGTKRQASLPLGQGNEA